MGMAERPPVRAAGGQVTWGPRELRWPRERIWGALPPSPRRENGRRGRPLTCVILLCTEDTMAEEMCPSFS